MVELRYMYMYTYVGNLTVEVRMFVYMYVGAIQLQQTV